VICASELGPGKFDPDRTTPAPMPFTRPDKMAGKMFATTSKDRDA